MISGSASDFTGFIQRKKTGARWRYPPVFELGHGPAVPLLSLFLKFFEEIAKIATRSPILKGNSR